MFCFSDGTKECSELLIYSLEVLLEGLTITSGLLIGFSSLLLSSSRLLETGLKIILSSTIFLGYSI